MLNHFSPLVSFVRLFKTLSICLGMNTQGHDESITKMKSISQDVKGFEYEIDFRLSTITRPFSLNTPCFQKMKMPPLHSSSLCFADDHSLLSVQHTLSNHPYRVVKPPYTVTFT